ncbi:MAG: DUF4832 domain-containing protein [Paludibacteraceae bacterium]|nr:DUF4832 domain-containing protein [Paludibacteraceae bacterium]
MKRLNLILVACLVTIVGMQAKSITYTADNTTDFCNPERGFYDHLEQTLSRNSNGSSKLSDSYFTSARNNNRTLLLDLYYLSDFTAQDLSQGALNQIRADFAKFRSHGCKAIVRFAYTSSSNTGDASLAQWQRHLDQLKSVLEDNVDVIYVVQAGFLGRWGEWYYSSYGTGNAIDASFKTSLIDKLLACVPASRCVQLRTPKFKKDYTGSSSAMSASDAHQNTAKGRLGHHNDAFLSDETNMGTYVNRTTDMTYLATECLYVPNGGETNMESGQTAYNKWAKGTIAEAEMAQLHYSYLNSGYSEFVTNQWRTEGVFVNMSRNLGYRFQLTTATLPETGSIGKKINVQLNIKNVGYAPLYNERHAYIVFKSSSNTYKVQLASDPRTWLPNGATTAINESITLPSNMVAGSYTMYLWLPDASASIANNANYAVRFANSNIWDSSTGYNKLNNTITVTAGGGQDDPDPVTTVDAVTDFAAAANGTSSVNLSWTTPKGSSGSTTEALSLMQASSYTSGGTATISGNTVSYANIPNWDVAGVQFVLADRTDIASISFTLTGNGQDVDFLAYVKDAGDAQWWSGEPQSLSSTTPATYTVTPSAQLWTSATYTYGTQPLVALNLVANPGQDDYTGTFSGSFTITDITLNLTSGGSVPANFTAVKILRKTGSYPSSATDGTVVYTGNAEAYTDNGLSSDTKYYYAAYSYNGTAVSSTVCQANATTDKEVTPTPPPSGDVFTLPGTLSATDATLSGFTLEGNMIQADPETAQSCYATWQVQVQCTGTYTLSAVTNTSNGYKLEFYVLDASQQVVAQIVSKANYDDNGKGDVTHEYGTMNLTAGTYTLKLVNNLEWTEAYIQSVTLANPGCSVSTDSKQIQAGPATDKFIRNGHLYIRNNNSIYSAWGF